MRRPARMAGTPHSLKPMTPDPQNCTSPGRQLFIVRMAAPLFFALMLCSFGLVAIPRSRSVRAIGEPPVDVLPGKNLPANAECESLHDGRFRCTVHVNGEDIQLMYDGASQRIMYTFMPGHDATLGDLILAWGTPTGYQHHDKVIAVSWNTRTAFLQPCSFEYTSWIAYVAYGQERETPLPWHGLVSQKGECTVQQHQY
jgi:hypothetical protein